MKISIVSDLYPPAYKGGHEIRCKVVADSLSKRKHDVHVITSNFENKKYENEKNVYRKLFYLNSDFQKKNNRYNQIKYAILGRKNYIITKKILKKTKPDIIYAGQLNDISIFPLKAITELQIPVVHHVGNYFIIELIEKCINEKNIFKKIFRQKILGFSERQNFNFESIIVDSKAVLNKYLEYGFNKKNVDIIHSTSMPNNYEPQKSKERKKIRQLLFVGRVCQEKGLHTCIDAMAILVNEYGIKDLLLNIVGTGDSTYIKLIQKKINDLKLTAHVFLLGKKPHNIVLQEYHLYDLLVVPSIWEEPFGLVITEAMAHGVPVVASRVGGIPDIIDDRKTGILTEPKNHYELAMKIKELIERPDLVTSIRNEAYIKFENKFSNKIIVDKVEKKLLKLLQ
jgi:glycosyltransferase involved in cell wall biosynthesis